MAVERRGVLARQREKPVERQAARSELVEGLSPVSSHDCHSDRERSERRRTLFLTLATARLHRLGKSFRGPLGFSATWRSRREATTEISPGRKPGGMVENDTESRRDDTSMPQKGIAAGLDTKFHETVEQDYRRKA